MFPDRNRPHHTWQTRRTVRAYDPMPSQITVFINFWLRNFNFWSKQTSSNKGRRHRMECSWGRASKTAETQVAHGYNQNSVFFFLSPSLYFSFFFPPYHSLTLLSLSLYFYLSFSLFSLNLSLPFSLFLTRACSLFFPFTLSIHFFLPIIQLHTVEHHKPCGRNDISSFWDVKWLRPRGPWDWDELPVTPLPTHQPEIL